MKAVTDNGKKYFISTTGRKFDDPWDALHDQIAAMNERRWNLERNIRDCNCPAVDWGKGLV